MSYELNQIFEGEYPPEAAEFCNKNNLQIDEIEPINGFRRFQIKAVEKSNDCLFVISALKRQLAETDYAVIKIAEGAATADEYADVLAKRRAWRARINELESMINKETTNED